MLGHLLTVVELHLSNPKTLPSYQTESLENDVMLLVCRNKTLKGEIGQGPSTRILIPPWKKTDTKASTGPGT